MPNNNNYITKENISKIEEVREIPTYQPKYTDEEVAKLKEIFIAEQKEAIKKYQIKSSPLSPEARNKVIRKWGSDYVSENREGYGPCRNSSCDCYCSADECICNNYTRYRGAVESKRSIKINKKTKIKGFQHLIHTGNDWADKNGGPGTKRGEWWDEEATGYSDGSFRVGSITTSAGANAGIGGAIASGGAGYSLLGTKDSHGETKFLSLSAGGELGAGPGGVVAGYSLGADLASVQTGGFSANVGYDAGSGVSFGAGGVEAKVGGVGLSIGKKMGFSTPFGGASIDLEEADCVVQ